MTVWHPAVRVYFLADVAATVSTPALVNIDRGSAPANLTGRPETKFTGSAYNCLRGPIIGL